MIQYLAWRISLLVWRILPLKIGYACASLLADIAYLAWPKGRLFARENMAYVLGNSSDRKTIGRLARQSLRNYCKYLVELIRLPMFKPEDIERKVTFEGWENIDKALQRGKGAVFIGLHLGNWDLAAAAMSLRNYPLNVIAETFAHPKLNGLVQGARMEKGLRVIPMEHATRGVVRVLQRNEILALLIDRHTPEDGVAVSFFNALTRVPAGAATLILKTGASVVTGGLVRLPNNNFLGLIDYDIPFQPSGDLNKDIQRLTQSIMSSLENMVRRYPDQWYMFRRMWVKNQC